MGHVAAASRAAVGAALSTAPTHAVPAATSALLPDLREITALPSASLSLSGFHLSFFAQAGGCCV